MHVSSDSPRTDEFYGKRAKLTGSVAHREGLSDGETIATQRRIPQTACDDHEPDRTLNEVIAKKSYSAVPEKQWSMPAPEARQYLRTYKELKNARADMVQKVKAQRSDFVSF
ncbi:MAG: hypothetical protein ACLRMZ_27965 [Blautia marasmi]